MPHGSMQGPEGPVHRKAPGVPRYVGDTSPPPVRTYKRPSTAPVRVPKRKVRVKAHHRRARRRKKMIGAYAQLANRATGAREGHLNPLISSMLSTLYANPAHMDWARFKPDVHKLLKELGKPDIDVVANPDEPGEAAHAYRNSHKTFYDPESYQGYATASPRSFRKDRRDNALSIALHEFEHTRQRGGRMPTWKVEGGADYWAKRLADIAGIDYYAAPSYRKYRVRYRRSRKSR